MTVFVDTSGIFAFLVQDDEMHERAKAIFSGLALHQVSLLTSSYIIVETISLLQRRVGLDSVQTFNEMVFPLLEVIWVSDMWHRRALGRVMTEKKRYLSITDCLSFEIMEENEVEPVFTFDRHFAERGFTILDEKEP